MTKNMKFNKKTILKTTTALTCLIGAVLLFNQTANAAPTTSTGTMTVSTTVGATCSITATELTFGAFANTNSVAYSSAGGGIVSTNCSTANIHTLRIAAADTAASGLYKMTKSGGNVGTASQNITFSLHTEENAGGTQLTQSVAFATATGTGISAAVATLFGAIAINNSGKQDGSYSKSMSLSVEYGA
jgi:hypothetical protein